MHFYLLANIPNMYAEYMVNDRSICLFIAWDYYPVMAARPPMEADGAPMPAPMPAPAGAPRAPGAGGAGGANEKAGGGERGQTMPEYKSVETVRQNFPEAWIWSELNTAGYA